MRLAVTGNPLTKRKSVRTLSSAQHRLLALLQEEPGSTLTELNEEGIYDCIQNVERALSGLISRGLITFVTVSDFGIQQFSYRITPAATKLLAEPSE
jgi:predicted transcriptional regulator